MTAFRCRGARDLAGALHLLFQSLFLQAPESAAIQRVMVNTKWILGRHEFEYGVTAVPLVLMVLALLLCYGRGQPLSNRERRPMTKGLQFLYGFLLILLLFTPLAINLYESNWNALLKQTPVLSSSSFLGRWFVIYIPILAVAGALSFHLLAERLGRESRMALLAMSGVIILQATTDRSIYHQQHYDPNPVVNHYRAITQDAAWQPRIKLHSVYVDKHRKVTFPINRNDDLIDGVANIFCYEPLFGYRLERLPWKPLLPGDVLAVRNGLINIKNPACYVFPEENGCRPGDHCKASEMEKAGRFVTYRPFVFEISNRQRWMNRISLGALIFSMLMVATGTVWGLWRWFGSSMSRRL